MKTTQREVHSCLIHEYGQDRHYLIFNADSAETDFGLTQLPLNCCWRSAIDIYRSAQQDLSAIGEETLLDNSTTYRAEARPDEILPARKQGSILGGGSA
jgi:hypothetical protein